MGFGEAINTCVKQKYATFQGRAARSEYWWFGLFFTLAMGVTGAIGGIAVGMTRSDGSQPGAGVILAFVPLIVVTLGLIIPILVDENGTIICGEARWTAASQLGLREIPTILISHLSMQQQQLLTIADNRLVERASWDDTGAILPLPNRRRP